MVLRELQNDWQHHSSSLRTHYCTNQISLNTTFPIFSDMCMEEYSWQVKPPKKKMWVKQEEIFKDKKAVPMPDR